MNLGGVYVKILALLLPGWMILALPSLGFPMSSWCNQEAGTPPRAVSRIKWSSLAKALPCVPGTKEALNQCVVWPNEPRGLADPGRPSVMLPHGLAPLLSDCVTSGNIFNCLSLDFLPCKVSAGSFFPHVAI